MDKDEIIITLKNEINKLYKDWAYDYKRFEELKNEHKILKKEYSDLIKILEQNNIKFLN